jgi:hypothetical protein
MYAIVATMNSDGTFDEVGMNNRAPVSHLKTEKGILNWARKYARGKTFKVDIYYDCYSNKPLKTIVETTLQGEKV